MDNETVLQHLINAEKLDQDIFGFGAGADFIKIQGYVNHKGLVSGVLGTKALYGESFEIKEEKKFRKVLQNLIQAQHLSPEIVNTINEYAKVNADINRLKHEREKIVEKYGSTENMFKAKEQIELDLAYNETCSIDALCTIQIKQELIQQIRQEAEAAKQMLFDKFKTEDVQYKRHRKLAKITVAVDVKLDGDDANRAQPIVFKDKNGHFVKDQNGNTHYLEGREDWPEIKKSIDRQLSREGKLGNDLSNDIIEEWENTSGSKNLIRLSLDKMDSEIKAFETEIYGLKKLINDLAIDKQKLLQQSVAIGNDIAEVQKTDEQLEALEKRSNQLKSELNKAFQENKAFSQNAKEIMEYIEKGEFKTAEEYEQNMPEHLKEFIKTPTKPIDFEEENTPQCTDNSCSAPEKKGPPPIGEHFQFTVLNETTKPPKTTKKNTASPNFAQDDKLDANDKKFPLFMTEEALENGGYTLLEEDGSQTWVNSDGTTMPMEEKIKQYEAEHGKISKEDGLDTTISDNNNAVGAVDFNIIPNN